MMFVTGYGMEVPFFSAASLGPKLFFAAGHCRSCY